MKQNQLGSLIAALHRTNQLGYPVMIVGAGLPKIYKMLSDEKSYSERLFVYKQVDSLTYEQSKKAIEEPVRKFHVSYTENAIKKIVEITKGYPFFIQQLCQIVYKRTDSKIAHRHHSYKEIYPLGLMSATPAPHGTPEGRRPNQITPRRRALCNCPTHGRRR